MAKTIVCRCEDVTVKDLKNAFRKGCRDIESLKRYTGCGTGFCQGKCCSLQMGRFLAHLMGGDEAVGNPPRTRPLLNPSPVGCFADEESFVSKHTTK